MCVSMFPSFILSFSKLAHCIHQVGFYCWCHYSHHYLAANADPWLTSVSPTPSLYWLTCSKVGGPHLWTLRTAEKYEHGHFQARLSVWMWPLFFFFSNCVLFVGGYVFCVFVVWQKIKYLVKPPQSSSLVSTGRAHAYLWSTAPSMATLLPPLSLFSRQLFYGLLLHQFSCFQIVRC